MSSITSWLNRLKGFVVRPARREADRILAQRWSRRPVVEALECRMAPAGVFDLLASFGSAQLTGMNPGAGMLRSSGNLYGTTTNGGSNFGTVYKMGLDGSGQNTLYSFTGGSDGANPTGGLVTDGTNLFGTTVGGGNGSGTVFQLTQGGALTTLYAFNGTDGSSPSGNLFRDSAGDLFGTTRSGGQFGDGTVFELSPTAGNMYTFTPIYSFNAANGTDGANPNAGVIEDASGNLFGTTQNGGGTNNDGTVFELVNNAGTYTLNNLHTFAGTDGANPVAGLFQDANGNLFSTAQNGGANSDGTVFELANSNGTFTFSTLHSFSGVTDGANPTGGVIEDAHGNLFGTTQNGGNNSDGTVFELSPSGTTFNISTFYTFTGSTTDGANPTGNLFLDSSGNLFGTTLNGGANSDGTAFKLGTPQILEYNPAGSGNNQSGTAGSALGTQLQVEVTDAAGDAVSGVTVHWATTSGGGSVSASTSVTNSSGVAAITATLGTVAGTTNTYTASVNGLTGSPLTFTATANAGTASTVAVFAGNNQTGVAGSTLASALQVKVTDPNGNPVAGVTVSWATSTTGASVSASSSVTNSSGIASIVATLSSTAGANTYTATATGLSGSPITFSETGNTPPPPPVDQHSGALIQGVAFLDTTGTGVRSGSANVLANTMITLVGTATDGTAVNESTVSDADGFYDFVNLKAGTYQIETGQTPLFQGNSQAYTPFTVSDGQVVNQDIAFTGLESAGLSLRLLLASGSTFPFAQTPNNQPVVVNPIGNVSVAAGASPTTINLAGNFSEADMTDSVVTFTVYAGTNPSTGTATTYQVQLFGKITPQTVANFLSYVNSGAYNATIFSRVQNPATDGFGIIQAGGFKFTPAQGSTTAQLTPITTDPNVNGEPSIANTPNTLAMALSNGPDSGNSQFFFNTTDNTNTFGGGPFTVFGKVLSTNQTTFNNLATPMEAAGKNESLGGSTTEIPLYNGYPANSSTFPGDTVVSNYAFIQNVSVTTQSAAQLTYSIVSNTNLGLVTPTFGSSLKGFDNNLLTLNYTAGKTGTAVITVMATNPQTGASVTTSFTVTVS